MALVCRHDIALFFANIDTPGEQQKYAVALLEHLFSLIPTCATVVSLYDIGCVLDRSLHLVSSQSFWCVSLTNLSSKVRYIAQLDNRTATPCDLCNACIRPPMGLPARLQSSITDWIRTYRWRGYGEALVEVAETYCHYKRLRRKFMKSITHRTHRTH
jgi:hypothetical protein